MSTRVEIIKPFVGPKKMGYMEAGRTHPFSNFTVDGRVELLVFRCNKDGSETDVYKAKKWTREVDLSKLDGEDYEHITTLTQGKTYFIEAKSRKESKVTRLIRFTQE